MELWRPPIAFSAKYATLSPFFKESSDDAISMVLSSVDTSAFVKLILFTRIFLFTLSKYRLYSFVLESSTFKSIISEVTSPWSVLVVTTPEFLVTEHLIVSNWVVNECAAPMTP